MLISTFSILIFYIQCIYSDSKEKKPYYFLFYKEM